MKVRKKKLGELDILRGLVCLLVILIHTTSEGVGILKSGSLSSIGIGILNSSLRFAVPAFIALSGFTLAYVYFDQNREFKCLEFYKKRLKTIVLPYIGWNIIYGVYFIQKYQMKFTAYEFLEKLIYGDLVYHMYFMVIIFQLYIIFPIFRWLYKKYNPLGITALLGIINYISYSSVSGEHADIFILNYIGFFALGIQLALDYPKTKLFLKQKFKLILGVNLGLTLYHFSCNYAAQHYNKLLPFSGYVWILFSTSSILAYLIFAIYLEERKPKLGNYLKLISIESFTIYLSHPLLLFWISDYYPEGFSTVLKIGINTGILFGVYGIWSYAKGKRIKKKRLVLVK